jgi:hypothetical protein
MVSAPNAPNRSGQDGRDRRSNFYELSDNLYQRVEWTERPRPEYWPGLDPEFDSSDGFWFALDS